MLTFGYAGQACKCGGPGSVEESYGYAGVVVHGIVESKSLISFEETLSPDKVDEVKRSLSMHQEFFEACLVYEVRLRVIESYKNEVDKVVTIFTTNRGASCGFRFQLGQEYIVYANEKVNLHSFFFTEKGDNIQRQNTYWTNRCTRTAEFSEREACALEEIKKENYELSLPDVLNPYHQTSLVVMP
ncbi:hypothetical protein GCM10009122_52820 [Fulvivirga kasyanovii]